MTAGRKYDSKKARWDLVPWRVIDVIVRVLSGSPLKDPHVDGLGGMFCPADSSLIPRRAHNEVARVLSFGAKKYSPDNWRFVPGWRWRYFAASLRHLIAWKLGHKYDRESKLYHLACAICSMYFLLQLDIESEET